MSSRPSQFTSKTGEETPGLFQSSNSNDVNMLKKKKKNRKAQNFYEEKNKIKK